MPDPFQTRASLHQDAEELLPWYATGQLGRQDEALVEDHLASCAHCRRQLSFDRKFMEEFARLTPEVERGWARIRTRLEPRERRFNPNAIGGFGSWRALARPTILALGFAQLLLVIVAGSVFLSLSRPNYRALASGSPPPTANIIATFRDDTTQAQLRDLLKANGASLVGGPTDTDSYLLNVPPRSRSAVLKRLRADGHVTLAEAIDAAK